jgi:hypothetical protein
MNRLSVVGLAALGAVLLGAAAALSAGSATADDPYAPADVTGVVQLDQGRADLYVVYHTIDRDGLCDPALVGAVSLHPVINMPVDFIIEAGDGAIVATSAGGGIPANPRAAYGVKTFSTARNAASAAPVKAFPPSQAGVTDECQAWVRVAQSIPGPLRVLVLAHTPEGDIGITADLSGAPQSASTVSLSFCWTLVTWTGADGTAPAAALTGSDGEVTALYGWDAPAQRWLAYFPAGASVPGANDLASLAEGSAYWVAVRGPGPAIWIME